MGCFGKNKGHIDEHAKWAYINLDDFHATSSWSPLSYLTVWFWALIGVAVFAVDCFTAVNLLILDKWASQIKPAIDLKISKWIFVGCIMFSFALYAIQWFQAVRVMRRGGVAESYMDPLAMQVQSMRRKGWKRFLVFAALTKSRKGADYVAFFVYFQFHGAIRIIFAEGGRQFVNAMTIVSVAKANLIPIGDHAAKHGDSPVLQFFSNVVALWDKDYKQAVILFSMCFTLAIWIFSALSLLAAVLSYVVFLWHHIPQSDGRLSVYCRRKIDRRLEKIVEKKVQAAVEAEEAKRQKAEAKFARKEGKGMLPSAPVRQPTLPNIGGFDEEKSAGFGLSRVDSNSTLPPYSSRPPTRNDNPGPGALARQPTFPDMTVSANMPPRLYRQDTSMSGYSSQTYGSNASLLLHPADMGHDSRPASPMDAQPMMNRQMSATPFGQVQRPGPARTMTNGSVGSQRGYGGPNGPTGSGGPTGPSPQGRMPPPARSNTAFSTDSDRSPLSRAGSAMGGPAPPPGPPMRSYTNETWTIPEQPSREQTPSSVYSRASGQPKQVSRQSFNRPFSPANRPEFQSRTPPVQEDAPAPRPTPSSTPAPTNNKTPGGYVAFNPYSRSPSVPANVHNHPGPPRRNVTAPVEMQPLSHAPTGYSGPNAGFPNPMPRSFTAPLDRGAYCASPDTYTQNGMQNRF